MYAMCLFLPWVCPPSQATFHLILEWLTFKTTKIKEIKENDFKGLTSLYVRIHVSYFQIFK